MNIPRFISKYQIPLGALLQTPNSNIIGYTADSANVISMGIAMKSTFSLKEYKNVLLLHWTLMIEGREPQSFSKQWSSFTDPEIIATDIECWIVTNLNKAIIE